VGARSLGKQTRENQGEAAEQICTIQRCLQRKESRMFSPIREEDMKIVFKLEASAMINCKVYPLNKKEMYVLREFLNEEERKGYIKARSSQYTSPVFFVRKKDSKELQPVMDY
jgi:hypothetical protein